MGETSEIEGGVVLGRVQNTEGKPSIVHDAFFTDSINANCVKVNNGAVGDQLYIAVRTTGLEGKEITANVIDGEGILTDKKYTALDVIQGENTTLLKTTVRNDGWAFFDFKMRPKSDTDKDVWIKKIKESKDKKIYLCILIDAHTRNGTTVTYQGINLDANKKDSEKGDKTNYWLDIKSKWFELSGSSCFCNRDFTVEELKKIITELRQINKDTKTELFYLKSSISSKYNLIDIDKSYESFTKELNAMFKKYHINTCIRKTHFLAQSSVETGVFSLTEENDYGQKGYLQKQAYYPYIGRGLLQLTHSGEPKGVYGYKQYFEYLNRTDYKTNYYEVSSNLFMAFDAAGYFWERGKVINKSTEPIIAKYPNSKGQKTAYTRTKVEKPDFTIINFNLVADDDNVMQLSYWINGGFKGFEKRKNYLEKLKEIFSCANL